MNQSELCFLASGGSSSTAAGTMENCILWIISFAPLDWIGIGQHKRCTGSGVVGLEVIGSILE